MPTKAPEQRRHAEDGSKCWCKAQALGIVGGLHAWRHSDAGGEFILSEKSQQMTTTEARAALGRRLSDLRARRNMTQRELGAALGVSAHHVYLLEAGRIGPSVGMVQAIAEVFGLGETELLKKIRFPKRGQ